MRDILKALKRTVRAAVARAVIAVAALFLVSLCITGAVAFALFSFYLYAAQQMTPAAAAAVTAGAAVVLALLICATCILALRIAGRPARLPASPKGRAPAATRGAPGSGLDAAADQAALWIAQNPRSAVLGAFVAGGMFGLSPQLRRAVADVIVAAVRPTPPRPPT